MATTLIVVFQYENVEKILTVEKSERQSKTEIVDQNESDHCHHCNPIPVVFRKESSSSDHGFPECRIV